MQSKTSISLWSSLCACFTPGPATAPAVPPEGVMVRALFPLLPIAMAPVINSRNCNIWHYLQCLARLLNTRFKKKNAIMHLIVNDQYPDWFLDDSCVTSRRANLIPSSPPHTITSAKLTEAFIPSTGRILLNAIQSCSRSFINHKLLI